MWDHSRTDRLHLSSLESANCYGITVHSQELNFVSFTLSIHMHNSTDIALIESIFREIFIQDHVAMFLDHFQAG